MEELAPGMRKLKNLESDILVKKLSIDGTKTLRKK
jgi:hypothetical protein